MAESRALARFGTGAGGFYDTVDHAEKLLTRLADRQRHAVGGFGGAGGQPIG